MSTREECGTACPPGEHSHYFGSYEPLAAAEQEADPEDVVPSKDSGEIDVWLTEWQVSEDGFDVALDERVDWELVSMDQEWLARMFAGRRPLTLQRDTYAGLVGEIDGPSEWTRLSGRVTRIDQVSVRYPVDRGSGLAEVGSAMQHTVSSVQERRSHDGTLVGWVIRIRDFDR
ncbi:DUF6578 domain-containing protein [Arthrobacter pityocampae]|uniref:DUF6578 domain-containing protein n=1 Tax=Arthrobacter pityocampae TaxID=547334 RepID=UPI0037358BCC